MDGLNQHIHSNIIKSERVVQFKDSGDVVLRSYANVSKPVQVGIQQTNFNAI